MPIGCVLWIILIAIFAINQLGWGWVICMLVVSAIGALLSHRYPLIKNKRQRNYTKKKRRNNINKK